MSTKKEILDLQTIDVRNLPELSGWKEKMETAVQVKCYRRDEPSVERPSRTLV